jgi:hypothetical protein
MTSEVSAARLSVAACDLPDRARAAEEVGGVVPACPDSLKDAHRRQAAAEAEEDQRQARLAADSG